MTLARLTALFVGLAILSACVTTHESSAPDPGGDRTLYAFALSNLEERYVEQLDVGATALGGLKKLGEFADGVSVVADDSHISLIQGEELLARIDRPKSAKPENWAAVTAEILHQARLTIPEVGVLPERELRQAVFTGMLSPLDNYSRYLPPDLAKSSREKRRGFGGIGIHLSKDGNQTVIGKIMPGMPADRSGLKQGDIITRIDDTVIQGMSLRAVVRIMRGPVGKSVRLSLKSDGVAGEITRDLIRAPVIPRSIETRLRDRILEVQIKTFNRETTADIRKALARAARQTGGPLDGIILDLRNNPGGLLDQAVHTADLFLEKGLIISTRGRHRHSDQIFLATSGQVMRGVPVVAIINGRTASAAEIVAVALRDHRRAALVGTSSFGKGSVQTVISLPNKGDLNITWARIFAPSGQVLDRQGIVPAICTTPENGASEDYLETLKNHLSEKGSSAIFRGNIAGEHHSDAGYKACPANKERPARDIALARYLLTQKPLYQAAVTGPALAETPVR